MSAPFKMKYQGNSSAFPFKEDSGSSKKKYEFKKVFKKRWYSGLSEVVQKNGKDNWSKCESP